MHKKYRKRGMETKRIKINKYTKKKNQTTLCYNLEIFYMCIRL